MHAYICMHTYACTHTQAHVYMHIYMHTYSGTHTGTRMYAHAHTPAHTTNMCMCLLRVYIHVRICVTGVMCVVCMASVRFWVSTVYVLGGRVLSVCGCVRVVLVCVLCVRYAVFGWVLCVMLLRVWYVRVC